MSTPFDKLSHADDKLWSLVEAHCDGVATDTERDALNAHLTADPAARRFLLAYSQMHAELAWQRRDAGDLPAKPAESAPIASAVTSHSPVLGFLGYTTGMLSKPVLWSILGVGLSFFIYVAVITWGIRDRTPHVAKSEIESVATITDSADVQWSGPTDKSKIPGTPWVPKSEIASGENHQIDSGLVELKLKQGTTLLVEGPAEWSIDGDNSATLKQGKLVAKVPAKAIGFTLETPTTTIVDLGTEFGVNASASAANVQVFTGRVLIKSAQARTNDAPYAPPIILSAGDSRRFETGSSAGEIVVSSIAAPERPFRRDLRKAPEKPRTVYPQSLVAYWNFDEDHGPAWDERGDNHAALDGVERVPGLVGRGAVSFSNKAGQSVRIPDRAGRLQFSTGFTVEAVFVSRWNGELNNHDEIYRKEDGANTTLAFQNDGKYGLVGPVLAFESITFGELNLPLDGQAGRPSFAELTDGKPHHAAATFDGASGEIAIYVDGVKRIGRSIGAKQILKQGDNTPALIGNYSGNLAEPFSGILDEVAVYAAALSANEIAEHWRRVRIGQGYFGASE